MTLGKSLVWAYVLWLIVLFLGAAVGFWWGSLTLTVFFLLLFLIVGRERLFTRN